MTAIRTFASLISWPVAVIVVLLWFSCWLLWGALWLLAGLVEALLAAVHAVKERIADGCQRAIAAIAGE